MKAKCISNRDVECYLTQGKVYEVIECDHRENYFTMVDDTSSEGVFAKWRFKVVPSFDDVIKDKEWEKRANAYQKLIDYKNQNEEKRTMNGLEAIELMKQGQIVIRISAQMLYRLRDGVLEGCDYAGTWKDNWLFDFNDIYEEYIEPKPLTGWERVNEGAETYFISVYQGVDSEFDWHDEIDTRCFDEANYFSTKEKAEEINFKQTLFRKLQRFSDENGGSDIDWKCEDSRKYLILYNHTINKLLIDCRWCEEHFGQVYFVSYEVAEKAIELFRDDLIKYFTQY